jgi:uncharacterized protein
MLQLNLDRYSLLFNRFSGALALAERTWLESLAERDRNDFFQKHNLFLTSEKEAHYRGEIDRSFERFRENRGLNFYVSPHFDCPMGCQYCFQQNVKTTTEKLKIEHIGHIMKFVSEEKKRQGIEKVIIVLFGGEPLLPQAYDFNRALLAAAASHGYKVRIVTSGTTVTDKYLTLMNEHKAIISDIDITIDGPEEVHNHLRPLKSGALSFHIIKDTIDTLLGMGLPVSAKINIGRENSAHLGQFFETIETFSWTGFPRFRILINFVRNFGGIEVQDQKLSDGTAVIELVRALTAAPPRVQEKVTIDSVKMVNYLAHGFLSRTFFSGDPRPVFCNSDSRTTYSIGPDGNVYSCNWMVGQEEFADTSILQAKKKKDKASEGPCGECDISTLCGGGCMIDRTRAEYFDSCYHNNIETIIDFAKQAAPRLEEKPYLVINNEFQW